MRHGLAGRVLRDGEGLQPAAGLHLRVGPKAQAKVARTIDLLEELGPEVGPPYVKTIRGRNGLLELRTTLGSDTFRLFFFRAVGRRLVVVHGIRKKSQRTPPRDLDTAEQRMKEYLRSRR